MKTAWFLMDVGNSDAFSVFDALPTGCILVDNGRIIAANQSFVDMVKACLLYTSPSPRDQRGSRMPSSA